MSKKDRIIHTLLVLLQIVVVFFIGQIHAGIGLAVTSTERVLPDYARMRIAGVFLIITAIVLLLLYWQRKKFSNRFGSIRDMNLKNIGIDVLIFIGVRIIVIIIAIAMEYVYGSAESPNDNAIFPSNINQLPIIYIVILFISTAILPPFYEELLFRALPMQLVTKKWAWVMAILSSLIFSSLHLSDNILGFLLYMFMGLGLWFAYYRRQNIWDSIFVHFLNNAFAVILVLLTGV